MNTRGRARAAALQNASAANFTSTDPANTAARLEDIVEQLAAQEFLLRLVDIGRVAQVSVGLHRAVQPCWELIYRALANAAADKYTRPGNWAPGMSKSLFRLTADGEQGLHACFARPTPETVHSIRRDHSIDPWMMACKCIFSHSCDFCGTLAGHANPLTFERFCIPCGFKQPSTYLMRKDSIGDLLSDSALGALPCISLEASQERGSLIEGQGAVELVSMMATYNALLLELDEDAMAAEADAEDDGLFLVLRRKVLLSGLPIGSMYFCDASDRNFVPHDCLGNSYTRDVAGAQISGRADLLNALIRLEQGYRHPEETSEDHIGHDFVPRGTGAVEWAPKGVVPRRTQVSSVVELQSIVDAANVHIGISPMWGYLREVDLGDGFPPMTTEFAICAWHADVAIGAVKLAFTYEEHALEGCGFDILELVCVGGLEPVSVPVNLLELGNGEDDREWVAPERHWLAIMRACGLLRATPGEFLATLLLATFDCDDLTDMLESHEDEPIVSDALHNIVPEIEMNRCPGWRLSGRYTHV